MKNKKNKEIELAETIIVANDALMKVDKANIKRFRKVNEQLEKELITTYQEKYRAK